MSSSNETKLANNMITTSLLSNQISIKSQWKSNSVPVLLYHQKRHTFLTNTGLNSDCFQCVVASSSSKHNLRICKFSVFCIGFCYVYCIPIKFASKIITSDMQIRQLHPQSEWINVIVVVWDTKTATLLHINSMTMNSFFFCTVMNNVRSQWLSLKCETPARTRNYSTMSFSS